MGRSEETGWCRAASRRASGSGRQGAAAAPGRARLRGAGCRPGRRTGARIIAPRSLSRLKRHGRGPAAERLQSRPGPPVGGGGRDLSAGHPAMATRSRSSRGDGGRRRRRDCPVRRPPPLPTPLAASRPRRGRFTGTGWTARPSAGIARGGRRSRAFCGGSSIRRSAGRGATTRSTSWATSRSRTADSPRPSRRTASSCRPPDDRAPGPPRPQRRPGPGRRQEDPLPGGDGRIRPPTRPSSTPCEAVPGAPARSPAARGRLRRSRRGDPGGPPRPHRANPTADGRPSRAP